MTMSKKSMARMRPELVDFDLDMAVFVLHDCRSGEIITYVLGD